MKFNISSNSPNETENIATKLGSKLKGGEVIVLNSELGGGKTTFTHGLAKGIGSEDKVASPTFMISKLYNGKFLDIYHFDFYRLNEPGFIGQELSEYIDNPKNVLVIEWPAIVSDILPRGHLDIKIDIIDEDKRKLLFTYPKSLSYLMSEYADISS
jgi:tRNA threonylcarbamoyladenosine biosynthesis protein TsaE